jgi:phosphoserine aminotransferase
MNVVFQLTSEELTSKFLDQADKHNFYGIKGHRLVGGCRVSLYNAISLEDVEKLVEFMKKFENEQ